MSPPWAGPRPLRRRTLFSALLYFTSLSGFSLALESSSSEQSSSPAVSAPPPPSPLDAELVRDGPLYPPLQTHYEDIYELDALDDTTQDLIKIEDKNYLVEPNVNQTIDNSHIYTAEDTKTPYITNEDTNTDDNSDNVEPNIDQAIDTSHIYPENTLKEHKNSLKTRYLTDEEIRTDKFDLLEANIEIEDQAIDITGENKVNVEDLTKDQSVQNEGNFEIGDVEDNSLVETKETEDATKVQMDGDRVKRSSGKEWEKGTKGQTTRRVKTGDTILNIRGAVRDAIGDAGAAPGPRPATRLDTFVIRPERPAATRRDPPRSVPVVQVPKHDREILVEAHARAKIPCDLTNTTELRWYKDNELVAAPLGAGVSGAEGVWAEGGFLVVGRATRGDAGDWRCTSIEGGRTVSGKPWRLLIYEPVRSVYLAVDGRRLDAGNTWVPVRDKTELEVRCVAEGGVPPPELSWRLLAPEPSLDHRPYLRVQHTNYSIEGVSVSHAVVTAARELHNATLQCEAKQRGPAPAAPPSPTATGVPPVTPTPQHVLTAKLEIHVTYPPSFVISRWPGFGVALAAGGAAALRCDVDANPPARAWWLRDDAHPTSSPPPLEAGAEARGSATLRWASLASAHAGWYRCRASWLDAEYSSIGYYLNVISPEENTESVTQTEPAPEEPEPEQQKVEVPLGGNVQLHCPKGSVGCWWRRVVGNSSESWAPAGSHHAHGVLGIKDALYQEGGEYRCVGARAPDLMRLRELKRVTLKVTGGATATALSAEPWAGGWRLECGACGRGVRVFWLRAGSPTPASLKADLPPHCWRAALTVREPDEVWCVAVTAAGAAVAVFPRRNPLPPLDPPLSVSPAPARHTVRALPANAPPSASARFSALLLAWYLRVLLT